ncbi:MAG TPA: DoxX family protein [Pyrinomonadaceae bacterium]
MADYNSLASRCAPYLLSVLRIVSGLLMLQHGTQKVFGWPPPAAPGARPPAAFDPTSLMGIVGLLELFGGLLLLIGLFTRPAAFILSGMMAVAYFIGHFSIGAFWPIQNSGELAVLYCFIFLYLSAAGGGPWSVDACLPGRRGGADASDAGRGY